MKVNYDLNKKHPQSILGFFSQYFEGRFHNGLTEYDHAQFLQEVQPYHVIGERNMLENFLGVRQALPCAAIRQLREDGQTQYWIFQRTDKVGEQKLAGMVACFWGGHVDGADVSYDRNSVLALNRTLKVGRDREQGEEYRIYKVGSPFDKDLSVKFPLTPSNQFIANSTVEVDKYHVAIIYTIDLPVGYEVEVLEEELIGMAPMTAQEALDAHEAGTFQLESWALIYFKHVRAQELLDSGAKVAIEPMVENVQGGLTADDFTNWTVTTTYKGEMQDGVLEWHHGSFYDAYVARGGKNWDEFVWKVRTLFEDPLAVLTAPKDAIAADLYPAQAQVYPMLFASKDGKHTMEQMIQLLDLITKHDFEMRVFLHQDLDPVTRKPVGEPYRLIDNVKVPCVSAVLTGLSKLAEEEEGDTNEK